MTEEGINSLLSDERRHWISVLIPLYNHANTVQRALDSILLSNTSRIELIICDDASKDQSFDIAQTWVELHAHGFARAVVLQNPQNLGITGNLNRLMPLAQGEFVTLVASDDELAAEAIDRQADYLESHPDADFVYANWGTIDEESRVVQDKVITDRRAAWLRLRNCAMVDIVFNWSLAWARLFARRTRFLRIGPYLPEHTLEDRWCALMIAQSRRFGYMHEVVHYYRLRPQGIGTAGLDQQRIFRDMRDVEERMVGKSTGLLRALLVVHTRAYVRTHRWAPARAVFRATQLAIIRAHNLLAGS